METKIAVIAKTQKECRLLAKQCGIQDYVPVSRINHVLGRHLDQLIIEKGVNNKELVYTAELCLLSTRGAKSVEIKKLID